MAIPFGVDIDRLTPTWKDENYALMVGRFHPKNNFELGLKVAAQVNCKTIIAGIPEKKFLWYYQRLRGLVEASTALKNRVEFVTPTDEELTVLLQDCSVFLSPRLFDYL